MLLSKKRDFILEINEVDTFLVKPDRSRFIRDDEKSYVRTRCFYK